MTMSAHRSLTCGFPGRRDARRITELTANDNIIAVMRRSSKERFFMKLLLTSSGISNPGIHDVLVDLLGKPIAESSALFVPTAIYPFPDGAGKAFQAISGNAKSPLCDLGWKSVGVLELTALPSIDKEVWVATVRESDALLVWGGDPVRVIQVGVPGL